MKRLLYAALFGVVVGYLSIWAGIAVAVFTFFMQLAADVIDAQKAVIESQRVVIEEQKAVIEKRVWGDTWPETKAKMLKALGVPEDPESD